MLKPFIIAAVDTALVVLGFCLRLAIVVGVPIYNFVMKTLMFDKLLAYVITHHRWVFAVFFLLPASFLTDLLFYARNRYIIWSSSAPDQHEKAVKNIQREVQEWRRKKDAKEHDTLMCTARPGWLATSLRVPKYKKTHTNIHVDLHAILSVDTERRIVRVEPLVTMGQITATLNPMGWTLPVLPELDNLTVGGLVCGVGIESSSHKHGLFQHTCKAFEMVLADGSLVRASPDENPDLFRAIPWSHGSLGFLVAVEISIIPATSHVRLEYTPCKTRRDLVAKFTAASKDASHDFVEGVLMTGTFADEINKEQENKIGLLWSTFLCAIITIAIHAAFSGEVKDIIPFGNHPLFRFALGWLMPPHIALLKRTQTEELRKLYEENHVVQDMLVPISKMDSSLSVFHKEFEVYPLWLCPMRIFQSDASFIHPTSKGEEMFIDIGAYGVPSSKAFHFKDSLRSVEKHVQSVEGFQMLYADSYLTREEFRKMFDHSDLDRLRKKHQAEDALPHVYDKVCKAARH